MTTEVLRRIVPGWAKQRHERWQTARFLRAANDISARYVERHGLEVRRGPFAGLRFPPELVRDSGDAVAKLVGAYELELRPVFEQWLHAGLRTFVDVGAAEGFYAVGVARAAPAARVVAFDVDPGARARCARLAAVNGVADRVRLEGACTPGALDALPASGVALLVDCEGCEREVLDPAASPVLRGWPILVELHDFIDPAISATVTGRFAATHEIEIIEGRDRVGVELPELDFLTPPERALALSERRPGPMRWALLRPRA